MARRTYHVPSLAATPRAAERAALARDPKLAGHAALIAELEDRSADVSRDRKVRHPEDEVLERLRRADVLPLVESVVRRVARAVAPRLPLVARDADRQILIALEFRNTIRAAESPDRRLRGR